MLLSLFYQSDDLSNTASSDVSNISSDISNAINEDHLYNEDEVCNIIY